MTPEETRLRRLKFRAWHRGFREADLILGPFADSHGPDLTPTQLDTFEVLLEQPDHDIYEWIVERVPTPPEFDTEIMGLLKAFRFKTHALRGNDRGG